jgi:hypothetical protein
MSETRSRILDPPGLRISTANQIAVASWDKAAFDAATFTVAGLWRISTGMRERHKIEVFWSDVERWARNRIDIICPTTGTGVGGPTVRPIGNDTPAVLAPESAPMAVAPAPATVVARVPFESRRAKALLAGEKVGGCWGTIIPTEVETARFLRLHFTGVPSDPHRKIRRELWPDNRRGPRSKRQTAD